MAGRGGAPARTRASRWLAAARRALPAAVLAGLAVDVALAPLLRAHPDATATAVALAWPPALLVLFLCGSEDPRFERPRWPRGPGASPTRPPPHAADRRPARGLPARGSGAGA